MLTGHFGKPKPNKVTFRKMGEVRVTRTAGKKGKPNSGGGVTIKVPKELAAELGLTGGQTLVFRKAKNRKELRCIPKNG